ncbi:MAG: metallophosphoesterase [Neomegalonema sp.]|nr:metallophosphoesterase [Neomegalonema sp.]
MISRRRFLQSIAGLVAGGAAFGGYAFGVEPFRLSTTRYRLTPPDWPEGLRLKIAALADLHACRPWMSPERIGSIVAQTNALQPDLIVLLGDYLVGHPWISAKVAPEEWAAPLAGLTAPLGTHAVLGNHDYWDDDGFQRRGGGRTAAEQALRKYGIPVYENDAVRLVKDGRGFWLVGLGDQLAYWSRGVDDLPGALAKLTDDAPAIMMAHEPDIFPKTPARIALTLSGHTHGGQVRLLGWSPVVPSRFRNRYAYGAVTEPDAEGRERSLIVSGGLGCSILPVRFGVPPEIVLVELG